MRIVTIDFETYFDNDYTLKKLTTEEYVRDERFEALGAAVRIGERAMWLEAEQVKEQCEVWETQRPVVMLAHHAHFDGLILSHHFGFQPDVWLDTLSMGRVVFDSGVKLGLDDIAARLGLFPKTVPYDLFRGYRWMELPLEIRKAVAEGACHDCDLTFAAFTIMMNGGHPAVPYRFPPSELPVIDLTVKMFTDPTLIGDTELLGQAWLADSQATQELFAKVGFSGEELRKDENFATALDALGVEPDRKTTDAGNEKYAFAKSDPFMQELLYDADPEVALLVEARLKAQSSIYRTRTERYGYMSLRGPMCIYLAYAAAHTRRWGGGDKTNFQNLPRPDPHKPQKGALRRAIKAP